MTYLTLLDKGLSWDIGAVKWCRLLLISGKLNGTERIEKSNLEWRLQGNFDATRLLGFVFFIDVHIFTALLIF